MCFTLNYEGTLSLCWRRAMGGEQDVPSKTLWDCKTEVCIIWHLLERIRRMEMIFTILSYYIKCPLFAVTISSDLFRYAHASQMHRADAICYTKDNYGDDKQTKKPLQ